MDGTTVTSPGLENGPNCTMSLQSSSAFGAVEKVLPTGNPLFSTDSANSVPNFNFPYQSSGQFNTSGKFISYSSSVSMEYNSGLQYNSVFNNSTPTNHLTTTTTTSSLSSTSTTTASATATSGSELESSKTSCSMKMQGDFKVNNSNTIPMDCDPENDTAAESVLLQQGSSVKGADGQMNSNHGDEIDTSDREGDEDPVECGNCDNEFLTLQEYMDHSCAASKTGLDTEAKSEKAAGSSAREHLLSDVESFDGKIVYNPDGSAYIIEGDSDSDLDSIIDLPQKEGVIIDSKGRSDIHSQQSIPQIDNAFFVPRNPRSFLPSVYNIMLPHTHQAPIMHSFKVYDLRSSKCRAFISGEPIDTPLLPGSKVKSSSHSHSESSTSVSSPSTSSLLSAALPQSSSPSSSSILSVPTKPILMCFICKLSFGFAKSFMAHAVAEHSMVLSSEEKDIMAHRHSSAIIQGIGKGKEPLMSFLEPIQSSSPEASAKKHQVDSDSTVADSIPQHANVKDMTSVSYMYTKPKLSESLTASNAEMTSKKPGPSPLVASSGAAGTSSASMNSKSPFSNLGNGESPESVGENSQIKTEPQETSHSDSALRQESAVPPHQNHISRFIPDELSSSSQSMFNMEIKSPASSSNKSYLPSLSSHFVPSSGRPGFYGACEEHPHGRAQGVECPNCDMVLSSSQSLGGHMTMMHSRNSCKTLKCPKCNWHYKYQETLEIHMKEKHPDSDQKCMYCLTNQSHPRLARGESYSCGYKPYRCEVCNYSTTTKGNLSIHMQSDKHLNNVQELANGGGEMKLPPQPPPPPQAPQAPPMQEDQSQHQQAPPSTPPHSAQQPMNDSLQAKKNKPKPTWRCDVCNYETNVARNLRIHMTSEKHTHNMMVLQQNMKHMQRDMQLHQMNQLVMLQQDPSYLGLAGPIPGGVTFPYDSSLMMAGLPAGFGGEAPMDLSKENGVGFGAENDMTDVSRLYQCCVCNTFGTDTLEALHQHLQLDRTKQRESENIAVANGTYLCNLCTYKTTLKANFQLHCKTDKHLQRLQLVNHIKEGGVNNEWRLKYLNVSNPVQVRCNACDYYTNSIHKLQIHTGNPRHEASAQLFCHLLLEEVKVRGQEKSYMCTLCKYTARSKLNLMQHVHSMQHLHSENLKQHQMKEMGQLEIDIGEIFMVRESDEGSSLQLDDEDGEGVDNSYCSQQNQVDESKTNRTSAIPSSLNNNNNNINNNNTIKETTKTSDETATRGDDNKDSSSSEKSSTSSLHTCPFCAYSSVSEMHIQSHVLSQHPQQQEQTTPQGEATCPLCQDGFKEKSKLETHLISVHNVTPEGLQKLLLLVDDSAWKMPPTSAKETTHAPSPVVAPVMDIREINMEALEAEAARLAAEDAIDLSQSSDKDYDEQFRCQTCSKTFLNIDNLYAHQNELGHLELKQTPRGPGYLCWKKGCNQYFKTAQALQIHFREIHAKRPIGQTVLDKSAYKYQCTQCPLAFKSAEKFQLHCHFHLIKSTLDCNFCTKSFQSIAALTKHVEVTHDLSDSQLEQYNAAVMANAAALPAIIGTTGLNKLLAGSVVDMSMKSNNNSSNDYQGNGKVREAEMNSENFEDDDIMDSDLSKNNSSSSTPGPHENGSDKGTGHSVEDGDADVNDVVEKEQQFFEDYINSQAFAEGSYEDPTRKYKCHRCKVAFTKQNYLTAHNKTLLHRKGDRLSYPMEKYLDPNRPYKCDVCKESFTQKNILLVHYNSVSHLHKVKQAASQGLVTPGNSTSPAPASQSQSQPSTPQPTLSPSLQSRSSPSLDKNSNINSKRNRETSAEDEGLRPYKCNICKVAYSQGSTLDIHIRSVAHQTKTSKLQELALSGEVDLTRPLIEEPTDPQKMAQFQQQKFLQDVLNKQASAMSQASYMFPGLPSSLAFSMASHSLMTGMPPLLAPMPGKPLSSTAGIASSQSSMHFSSPHSNSKTSSSPMFHLGDASSKSLEKISQQLMLSQSMKGTADIMSAGQFTSSHNNSNNGNSLVGSSSSATSGQGILSGSIHVCQRCSAVFASQESFIQHQMFCSGNAASPSTSLSLTQQASIQSRSRAFIGRVKPQVHRNLLENFGFECVMQFNEFNQPMSGRGDSEAMEESASTSSPEEKKENQGNPEISEVAKAKPISEEKSDKEEPTKTAVHLPEMNKCICGSCKKEFSSVWVLKAHQEEVHRDLVPISIVEDVGDQFKTDFEKKLPKEPETPIPMITTPGIIQEENVVKQEMPPPPPPPPQPQPDMLQMMNMFGIMPMPMPLPLMNMQPSMMPMMMPHGLDKNVPQHSMDQAASISAQQKQLQQAAMQNQKRARTRINDEQLKILRGYFDINNSPSEEQIQQMSDQAALPTKVIKHWFRNTLFKERQRNKDSPYNFNNPPSTTLDLAEYEKTGKLPVTDSPPALDSPLVIKEEKSEASNLDLHEKKQEVQERQEPVLSEKIKEEIVKTSPKIEMPRQSTPTPAPHTQLPSRSHTPPALVRTPSTDFSESMDLDRFADLSQAMSSKQLLSSSSTPTTPLYENHSYSPPGGSSGRRANRTRFTDYQIKILQEYFEQNAYPKDDELDHLSKLLNLSPRVIVVWFQNARQKARKIYENQPNSDSKDGAPSTPGSCAPYNRTPGLNYQCKKCQAVFQRYYDLIRHQKRQCFTEREKMDSHMLSDDSDSLSHVTSLDDTYFSDQESETSSNMSKSTHTTGGNETPKFKCEKCNLSFPHLDLWREHQNVHSMNPGLFLSLPANSAFGVLQNMAAAQQQQQQMQDDRPGLKRKLEEQLDDDPDQPRDKRLRTTILPEQLDYLYQKYQIDCNPSRKQLEAISKDVGLKKRVVQVWFQNTRARERKGQYRAHQQLIHKRCPICRALFRAKSALESHLATKHPDEMAKGEINVDAIPDAAIESPNSSQPQLSPMMSPSFDSKLLAPPGMQGLLPLLPPVSLTGMGFPPMADPIQMSMKQFYEDSFKKYINELSSTSQAPSSSSHKGLPSLASKDNLTSTPIKAETVTSSADDLDAPLDLSKPLKVSSDHDRFGHDGPASSLSGRSSVDHSFMKQYNLDNSLASDFGSEAKDEESSNMSSSPTSPMASHHSLAAQKRYRTQMTSLQVRIMKQIFIEYKTPTMAECEMLGRVIGLQKRVVQVWFQNARAKEKKAKLNMAKAFGPQDMDFPKPPEECTLCNFKYSHKYTIQDHIFTKKHIDAVKSFIMSQSDAERELSSSSSSVSGGVSGLLRSQQPSEMESMRKAMEEASAVTSQSQMSQLSSMGLGHLGAAYPGMSGMSPMIGADIFPEFKKESLSSHRDKEEKKESEKKRDGSGKKEPSTFSSSEQAQHLQGLNFFNSFGGFLPGMEPSFLPYMYPSLPGIMPGMGLPMLQPGLFPGSEQLLGYDPMTYGTPLPLLQIPQQAIKDVSSKLMDPKATVGQYTQDCKSISSLRSLVGNTDYSCARESTVDVGYICKKCQMVYPARDACMNHQRMGCFPGKASEGIAPILKLEQIQYECKLCSEKVSSVHEFKSHCQLEAHKVKVSKYHAQKASSASVTSGGVTSKPVAMVTLPSIPKEKPSSVDGPLDEGKTSSSVPMETNASAVEAESEHKKVEASQDD